MLGSWERKLLRKHKHKCNKNHIKCNWFFKAYSYCVLCFYNSIIGLYFYQRRQHFSLFAFLYLCVTLLLWNTCIQIDYDILIMSCDVISQPTELQRLKLRIHQSYVGSHKRRSGECDSLQMTRLVSHLIAASKLR